MTIIFNFNFMSDRNYLIVHEGNLLNSEALLLIEILLVLEDPLIEELLELLIAVDRFINPR